MTTDYERGKIKLQWTPSNPNGSPFIKYTITKDVGSGVFYPIYEGLNTTYTDANLISGAYYNYKIYPTTLAG